MSFELEVTADGSLSCRDSETGQLCHNNSGAYTEALLNYAIPSGAVDRVSQQPEVTLLDACYGLGYNTWVLVDHLCKTSDRPFSLNVVAVESSPDVLSYFPRIFEHPTLNDLKNKLGALEHNIDYRTQLCTFNTKWGLETHQEFAIDVAENCRIHFYLIMDDLRKVALKLQGEFDWIFHDPFSPQKMPELWTEHLFREYHRLLKVREGCLLTYSGAAGIRGGLTSARFHIGKTQALGAKSGGTIAWIPQTRQAMPRWEQSALALESWELEYLQTRAGVPYPDPGLAHGRDWILQERERLQNASNRPSGSNVIKPRNYRNLQKNKLLQL